MGFHTDDRLEQFRDAIRRDALELALTVQRTSQDLHQQVQSVEQLRRTLFDVVQVKVDHFGEASDVWRAPRWYHKNYR